MSKNKKNSNAPTESAAPEYATHDAKAALESRYESYLKSIGKENISQLDNDERLEMLLNFFKSDHSQPKTGISSMDNISPNFGENNINNPTKRLTKATAQTSDDYLELAKQTPAPNIRLRYLRKALELDPLNFDATSILINLKDLSTESLVKEYTKAYADAKNTLAKEGYMTQDCIGDFWLILETRPFMRLMYNYMIALINTNRLHDAIELLKEALTFNTSDNLGLRYDLMHIYVKLQRFDDALKLHAQYKKDERLSMLLPLSVLYYTTRNYTKSRNILKKLAASKQFCDVFTLINSYGLDYAVEEAIPSMLPDAYEEIAAKELLMTLENGSYLYRDCQSYFEWAYEELEALDL